MEAESSKLKAESSKLKAESSKLKVQSSKLKAQGAKSEETDQISEIEAESLKFTLPEAGLG
ncbi:MAG: hypothetical protein JXA35_10055 [Deltaproteobacteria bacterium]|nr:hypothetical protein [Deltaproteobacteria bacterium]